MDTTPQRRDGGGEVDPASLWDIDSYQQAEDTVALMHIPQFVHADNPHERLFVAGLDGTGNSMFKDTPDNQSAVAKIYQQIRKLEGQGTKNIAGGYVEGSFTQSNPFIKYPDGALGITFDERVETAYYLFCEQSKKWIEEDPQAQIRVAGVGFSRGAEEVAALTRMVHERGIMDPKASNVQWSADHRTVTHAVYHGEPLVPPGQTLQAALLFDPVSTGVAEHDRRLAPSVVSALQITAKEERRDQFKADLLVTPGLSADRRHANVLVGGAHSDVGDTYTVNGLGVLSHNLGASYLNRFSDVPLVQQRELSQKVDNYVVHRSEQSSLLWSSRHYDNHGLRGTRDDLAPASTCEPQTALECRAMEPTNPALREQAERLTPEQQKVWDFSIRMDRMLDAAERNDWDSFRNDTLMLANSDAGRALREQAVRTVDHWDEQARLAEQQRLAERQAQQQRGQGMSL
jgi:hypothetical protein